MKSNVIRTVCVVVVVAVVSLVGANRAVAQYPVPVAQYPFAAAPVAYTSVQPEVIGYQFEWRGLLGLRSRWNPVVAPVARTVVTPPVVEPVPVYTSVPTVVPSPAAPVVSTPPVLSAMEPINPVAPVTYETVYQVRY